MGRTAGKSTAADGKHWECHGSLPAWWPHCPSQRQEEREGRRALALKLLWTPQGPQAPPDPACSVGGGGRAGGSSRPHATGARSPGWSTKGPNRFHLPPSSPRTSDAGEEGDRRGLWPRGAHGSDQSELLEDRERSGPKAGTCKCPRALVPGLPCRTPTLQISVLVGKGGLRADAGPTTVCSAKNTQAPAQHHTREPETQAGVGEVDCRIWGLFSLEIFQYRPGSPHPASSRLTLAEARVAGESWGVCGGWGAGHSCPAQGPSRPSWKGSAGASFWVPSEALAPVGSCPGPAADAGLKTLPEKAPGTSHA